MINDAHQSLISERCSNKSFISNMLKLADVIIMEDKIDVIQDIHNVTHIFVKTNSCKIKHVKLFTARIVANLDSKIARNSRITNFAQNLCSDNLNRRSKFVQQVPNFRVANASGYIFDTRIQMKQLCKMFRRWRNQRYVNWTKYRNHTQDVRIFFQGRRQGCSYHQW